MLLLLALTACPSRSSGPAEPADGGRPGAAGFGKEGAKDAWVSGCWKAGAVKCDPRSNLGCDTAAGQVCEIGQDVAKNYILECFPPPNDRKLGQSCSRKSGPYCGPTLHCAVDGVCRHFCCSDVDCSGHDQCVALPGGTFGTIGVCAGGPLDAGGDGG